MKCKMWRKSIYIGFITAYVDTVASVESRENKSHEGGRLAMCYLFISANVFMRSKTRGWQGVY